MKDNNRKSQILIRYVVSIVFIAAIYIIAYIYLSSKPKYNSSLYTTVYTTYTTIPNSSSSQDNSTIVITVNSLNISRYNFSFNISRYEEDKKALLNVSVYNRFNQSIGVDAYLYNPSNTTVILYRNMSIITDIVSNTSFINNEYPCSYNSFIIAIALYKGIYNVTQLYNKSPLLLYKPFIVTCPLITGNASPVYLFSRSSNISIYYSSAQSTDHVYNTTSKTSYIISSYWIYANNTYKQEPLNGSYTLLIVSPYTSSYDIIHIHAKRQMLSYN
ncbi:MAG: hypothetical protein ARM1_0495 [Candidatus Micrarchaeota archaeon]|nr:MAG: hypothetical protein ARM1_0495 [Candidatus Micrarchaeota archaeon]